MAGNRPRISTVSRFEWIQDIALTANNTQVVLPTNGGLIPNDRFLFGLELQFEGRITNAASNNPTGIMADAQYALLDTIQVQGFHRLRGLQEQFINARGPDLRELALIYGTRAPFNQNSPATGPSGVSDFRFMIPIWFVPMGVSLAQQIDFLLDAPNYDALKLNIQYGDDQSVFSYGTRTAPTFSAFGSGSGNPRIRVSGWFAQAGQSQFANFIPARLWRYFDEQSGVSQLTSTTTNARLHNVPRGYKIRNVLHKVGVKASAVAAGNNSYLSLSNTILQNIKMYRGLNKAIRFYADQFGYREDGAAAYSITPDNGYALMDFAQHGTVHEAFDTTGLAAGPTGDTDVFIAADTTGAASQASLALYEELRGDPSA